MADAQTRGCAQMRRHGNANRVQRAPAMREAGAGNARRLRPKLLLRDGASKRPACFRECAAANAGVDMLARASTMPCHCRPSAIAACHYIVTPAYSGLFSFISAYFRAMIDSEIPCLRDSSARLPACRSNNQRPTSCCLPGHAISP